MEFEHLGRADSRERLAQILAAFAVRGTTVRTATEWLTAVPENERDAFGSAIEGSACPQCGRSNAIIIGVTTAHTDYQGNPIAPGNRISLGLFSHDRGDVVDFCPFSAEQAKELVNRRGAAIAVAERIDAEGTVIR